MATVAIISLIVSAFSMVVSACTFWQNGEAVQTRRRQLLAMRVVGGRAFILYDQLKTANSVRDENPGDGYYFGRSIQINAKRLEEALDNAIGLGLLDDIVTDQEYALPMHTAFVQALAYVAGLSDPNNAVQALVDDHIICGLCRLLGSCSRYKQEVFSKKMKKLLPPEVGDPPGVAWNYLQAPAPHPNPAV